MIDITKLPDAWEMVERLGEEGANENDELYDIYYKISTALFDYRLKYNLTQRKLAEKLGISQPMVVKLESGDYNYTIEQLWRLAKKLNFKLSIDFDEIKQNEYSVFSEEDVQDNLVDYEMDFLAVGS